MLSQTVHVNFSTFPLLERAAAINATCFPTSRRIIRKSIVFQGEDEIIDSTASRWMVRPISPPLPPTVGNSVKLFPFPFLPSDCKVLLCDFHREQAWDRWLSKTSNDVRPYKEGILVYFRRIAKAESIDEFDKAVETLKESHIWGANYSKNLEAGSRTLGSVPTR